MNLRARDNRLTNCFVYSFLPDVNRIGCCFSIIDATSEIFSVGSSSTPFSLWDQGRIFILLYGLSLSALGLPAETRGIIVRSMIRLLDHGINNNHVDRV